EIPTHILLVPEYELHHIKNAIVKELQKRLKNHYSKVENQLNKIKEPDQATSESIFKPKKKFHLEKGLLIEWRMKGFNNKAEHRCESGEVTFRFIVDQGQF
ncbi:16794_t:CDS:2, partial [Cetraspora pellucida]